MIIEKRIEQYIVALKNLDIPVANAIKDLMSKDGIVLTHNDHGVIWTQETV